MDILIVGMGKFGTALGAIYEAQGFRLHKIKNAKSEIQLSAKELRRSLGLLCVPTQALPTLFAQRSDTLLQLMALVSTAKGLLQKEQQTPLSYIAKNFKAAPPLLAMSGPSFASELRRGQPTALVLAGKNKRLVSELSERLSTTQLRLYKSSDPFGVELCGALKNIYAIASGISTGLGFGDNTKAALTSRALAEMVRIGKALGADPRTFFGLAGAGDLFLTCSSSQSRNFQFGVGLARGAKISTLTKKLGTVEGLWTTQGAKELCRQKNIEAPLLEIVAAIIEGGLSPQKALKQLMSREVRHEYD